MGRERERGGWRERWMKLVMKKVIERDGWRERCREIDG
jgi:hypothetical protein